MRHVVVFLFASAVLLAGCGSEDAEQTGAPGPEPVTVTEIETLTQTETVTGQPEPACSTAGLRLKLPEQELPSAVADVRRRVFEAALACDYETLERIAEEKGEGFTFSYGDSEDASEFWREAEATGAERPLPLHALAAILTMPFTRNESGSYAWPTAYNENPTDEAWQALVDAGLYSEDQVEQMRTQGTGYLGYRTAITADGDWQFFVAGD